MVLSFIDMNVFLVLKEHLHIKYAINERVCIVLLPPQATLFKLILFHRNWDERSLLNQSNLVIFWLCKIELFQVFSHPQNRKLLVLHLSSLFPPQKKKAKPKKPTTKHHHPPQDPKLYFSISHLEHSRNILKHLPNALMLLKWHAKRSHQKGIYKGIYNIWAVWEQEVWYHFYSLKHKSSLKEDSISSYIYCE